LHASHLSVLLRLLLLLLRRRLLLLLLWHRLLLAKWLEVLLTHCISLHAHLLPSHLVRLAKLSLHSSHAGGGHAGLLKLSLHGDLLRKLLLGLLLGLLLLLKMR
jgi:hypothetical protein